ncbi:hypothetical protein V6N13_023701 [Hibiscus sabdariffa]
MDGVWNRVLWLYNLLDWYLSKVVVAVELLQPAAGVAVSTVVAGARYVKASRWNLEMKDDWWKNCDCNLRLVEHHLC